MHAFSYQSQEKFEPILFLYFHLICFGVDKTGLLFLFHSVPMDEEDKVVLDYSSDPLMVDGKFRHSILSSIARAGSAIEELYGSAQDIEGVIRDGKVYVVQTRPQM